MTHAGARASRRDEPAGLGGRLRAWLLAAVLLGVLVSLAAGSLYPYAPGSEHGEFDTLLFTGAVAAAAIPVACACAAVPRFLSRSRRAAFLAEVLLGALPVWWLLGRQWSVVLLDTGLRFKSMAGLAGVSAAGLLFGLGMARFASLMRHVSPPLAASLAGAVLAAAFVIPDLRSVRSSVTASVPALLTRQSGEQAIADKTSTVVLLTFDALRSDHLGFYGYRRDTAPELDAALQPRLLYRNAFAVRTRTGPSIAAILTGLYPARSGCWRQSDTLGTQLPTVARLAAPRAATAAFVANPVVKPSLEAAGFETVRIMERSGAGQVLGEALKWLEARAGRPVFLYVHLMEPHTPYLPSDADYRLFRDDGLGSRLGLPPYAHDDALAYLNAPRPSGAGPDPVLDEVSRYDAAIRGATREAARFLDAVRAERPDLFVIVASDHGESMVEHGLYFWHGRAPYHELINIPFIVSWSRLRRSEIVETPVSHVDILPTLCARIGCPATDVDGLDVLSLGETPWRARALMASGDENPRYSSHAIVKDSWKLILKPVRPFVGLDAIVEARARVLSALGAGPEPTNLYRFRVYQQELYHLPQDPGELRSLSGSRPDLVAELGGEAMAELDREFAAPKARPGVLSPREEAETRDRLRALGYLR